MKISNKAWCTQIQRFTYVGLGAHAKGQWQGSTVEPLSNPDTNGAEESVIVREVSSFQGCPHRERGFTV